MQRFWSLLVEKNESRKKITIATTEEMVENDLNKGEENFIINYACKLVADNPVNGNPHYLLAFGALYEHTLREGCRLIQNSGIKEETGAPTGDPVNFFAGSDNEFPLLIWEINIGG